MMSLEVLNTYRLYLFAEILYFSFGKTIAATNLRDQLECLNTGFTFGDHACGACGGNGSGTPNRRVPRTVPKQIGAFFHLRKTGFILSTSINGLDEGFVRRDSLRLFGSAAGKK
jgi:hypothetical protein